MTAQLALRVDPVDTMPRVSWIVVQLATIDSAMSGPGRTVVRVPEDSMVNFEARRYDHSHWFFLTDVEMYGARFWDLIDSGYSHQSVETTANIVAVKRAGTPWHMMLVQPGSEVAAGPLALLPSDLTYDFLVTLESVPEIRGRRNFPSITRRISSTRLPPQIFQAHQSENIIAAQITGVW